MVTYFAKPSPVFDAQDNVHIVNELSAHDLQYALQIYALAMEQLSDENSIQEALESNNRFKSLLIVLFDIAGLELSLFSYAQIEELVLKTLLPMLGYEELIGEAATIAASIAGLWKSTDDLESALEIMKCLPGKLMSEIFEARAQADKPHEQKKQESAAALIKAMASSNESD